jgi:hypothetical protein
MVLHPLSAKAVNSMITADLTRILGFLAPLQIRGIIEQQRFLSRQACRSYTGSLPNKALQQTAAAVFGLPGLKESSGCRGC